MILTWIIQEFWFSTQLNSRRHPGVFGPRTHTLITSCTRTVLTSGSSERERERERERGIKTTTALLLRVMDLFSCPPPPPPPPPPPSTESSGAGRTFLQATGFYTKHSLNVNYKSALIVSGDVSVSLHVGVVPSRIRQLIYCVCCYRPQIWWKYTN